MTSNVEIKDSGKGNKISVGAVRVGGKLIVHVKGNNNEINIPNIRIRKLLRIIISDDNNRVDIGERCILEGLMMLQHGSKINIGNEVTAQDFYILSFEGAAISIGDHCMFGRDVHLRNSDMHSIFDLKTRKRINSPRDTIIEDHVWMAHRVNIMKGVRVGRNSIVGASSVVSSGTYPENAILAGSPAKVVREGIIWDRWLGDDLDAPTLSPYLKDYLPET